MRSVKGIVLLSIIALVLSLSVGYVSITTSIKQSNVLMKTTDMNVIVTDVDVVNVTGFADPGSPLYTDSTAYFYPVLDDVSESVTYSMTLTNHGDKTVLLDSVQLSGNKGGNSKINLSSSTPAYELQPGESTTMSVIASYDPTIVVNGVENKQAEVKCVVVYIEE